MAIRNRKLFPSLTYTNETTYCPDFCDPTTCPYDCPTFLPYLPPPPPQRPPPQLPSSPSSSATHASHSFITASALIVGFFILIGYYIIIAKSCFRRPSRNEQRHAPSDGGETEYIDGNRLDHPIWLIATVGLQQSTINAITICQYWKGEGLIEGTECSVCLNHFREGERLRLLPKCSHAFHISCIDTWLRSHTNCPLCRANIVILNEAGFGPTVDSVAGDTQQREDSRLSIEIQVENNPNRGETEDSRSLQEVDMEEIVLKKDLELELVNGESGTKEINAIDNVRDQKETEQSVGVDCYSSAGEIQVTEERRLQRLNLVGKGVVFTDKDMVCVGRSQSCNGGFFLSRHRRSTSSSLP